MRTGRWQLGRFEDSYISQAVSGRHPLDYLRESGRTWASHPDSQRFGIYATLGWQTGRSHPQPDTLSRDEVRHFPRKLSPHGRTYRACQELP